MHTHLYSQTGHYVTPRDAMAFIIILAVLAVLMAGKKVLS
jgi:hypothetical protein